MLRVTKIEADGRGATLRVEGRLTEQTAEELDMACETALAEGRSIQLDVTGLQFVDPSGVTLLRRLERRGARLTGCSGLVGELLRDRGDAPADPEALLVERLRRGDTAAYEALVRQHGGRMLATARRFVGSTNEAEDVVQEAFLAAFRAIDTFAGAARLSTWLHRIVVNAALMKIRSRSRRKEESIEGLLPRFDDQGYWVDPPAQWDETTAGALERRETRQMVRGAIAELPETHRTVLMLRDIEDLDTDEAASLLGISPNAVKVRLHRARQALRTLIDRRLRATATAAEDWLGRSRCRVRAVTA